MLYDTVIWDLDGTLLNTLDDLSAAVNYALREYGLPERSREEVRRFLGNGVRRLMSEATVGGESNPRFEEVFATFKSYYVDHCRVRTNLYPGIREALHALRAAGVRMAVVSNKLQAGVDELYDVYFRDTIEVAVGESSGVPRKPAPDMVDAALARLGVGRDGAVYVGDSEVDILTARNASLPCISVLWGFRDRRFLLEHGAVTLAESPSQLVRLITSGL